MAELVPAPDLDLRDEERLAAEMIARVSGQLTVVRIDAQIETLRELRALVENGALTAPVCPELTTANPSSPHTVLLETFGWGAAQIARRINQLPVRDQIEFARLFNIELREATAATTTLRFTVETPVNVGATIPAGTQVSTEDDQIVFETTAELVMPYGTATASIAARRTVAGATSLAPNKLTKLVDAVAYVTEVTNLAAVESGTDKETVAAALSRARNYQRRAERLVSARDIEDAILEEVMGGNGIVRAFPFIKDGDFAVNSAGHITIVVMTRTGNPVSDEVKQNISALLDQLIGAQWAYVKDPMFVAFNVEVDVRLTGLTPQAAILRAIERNLRDFYSPAQANFGRKILRSEIIAVIEGTGGVDRIEAQENGDILISPAVDVAVAPYQIPRLDSVVINVVN